MMRQLDQDASYWLPGLSMLRILPFLRPACAVLAAVISLPGCATQGEEPWHAGLDVWEGEHDFAYYSSPSREVCAGTHEYVSGFVPFVAGEFNLVTPTGLAYGWLDNEAYAEGPCPKSLGCSTSEAAFSKRPDHLHEVVHSVARPHGMNSLPFLTEGLAVAYDPDTLYVNVIEGGMLQDPQPLMIERPLRAFNYGVAGGFVAFLLSRHGPEKFVAFAQRAGEVTELAAIQQVFAEIYSVELDSEAKSFAAGAAECSPDAFHVRVYDCAMPEVTWTDPLSWNFVQSMDCADEGVVGGLSDETVWPSQRSVTFEIPRTGRYQIEVASDGDTRAHFGPCFGCPWDGREFGLPADERGEFELDAGVYYLRMIGESDESPVITVDISPLP